MSVISYTAHSRATLMGGHSAGTGYSFAINFMAYEKSYNAPKSQPRALDGTTETILQRLDRTIGMTIGPYDSDDVAQIEEFIESVAGGESFTVDVYGTIAVPDAPLTVKLSDTSNSPQRQGPRTYTLGMSLIVV